MCTFCSALLFCFVWLYWFSLLFCLFVCFNFHLLFCCVFVGCSFEREKEHKARGKRALRHCRLLKVVSGPQPSLFLLPALHEMKSFMPNMVLPPWYSSSPWLQSPQTQELGTETMWPNKSPLPQVVYRQVFLSLWWKNSQPLNRSTALCQAQFNVGTHCRAATVPGFGELAGGKRQKASEPFLHVGSGCRSVSHREPVFFKKKRMKKPHGY